MNALTLNTHNGEITVNNPATGNHRTFRIRTISKDSAFAPGRRIVELLTGPDNTSDYRGFAFVDNSGTVYVWRSKRGDGRDRSEFEKFASILNHSNHYAEKHGLEFSFSRRCIRCNRLLTDPESIALGIGPVCRTLST